MPDSIVCTRAIKDGSFSSEPGPTRFLKTPDPFHEMNRTSFITGWKIQGVGFWALLMGFSETAPPAFSGWFMTACAASRRAPFWFDTLGRVDNIRSAGKAPAQAEK